jgi:hypothetical protein
MLLKEYINFSESFEKLTTLGYNTPPILITAIECETLINKEILSQKITRLLNDKFNIYIL